jgi:hypothetical protein
MFEMLVRAVTDLGPDALWIAMFCAVIVAVFVLYIGIAMWATIRAPDPQARKIRYQMFHDLLDLFRRRRDR